MDKQYKPLFVRELKRLMAQQFPNFKLRQVPSTYPQRDIFAGALLFALPLSNTRAVWLWWVPGPGVERYFDVLVGWSPGLDAMPHHGQHEQRLHSLRGPHPDFPAAAIRPQQIQGESAIGGFTIPTPWDQVSTLKPMAPRREHLAAMEKAQAEAAALTNEQRIAAVVASLEAVFAALHQVLPVFTQSREAAGDAEHSIERI